MAEQQQNVQLMALNSVKALLEASRGAVAQRIPRHLTVDRILKVALTAINKTPKLLECSRESLITAVMQAAELGLEPGGALGEGYLVPYNNKVKLPGGGEQWVMQCQFIPGYRGLTALARRSGEISNIYAEAVYDGDAFEVELGLEPKLLHRPDYNSEKRDDPNNLTFTYAVARFKDGSFQFVVLGRKQIEALRARSKAAGFGPWVTDFEEMAKKTSIRRLSKSLPLSVEMAKAIDLQAAAEVGDFSTIEAPVFELDAGAETKALVESAPNKTESIKATVRGKAAAAIAAKSGAEPELSAADSQPAPPATGAAPSSPVASQSAAQTRAPIENPDAEPANNPFQEPAKSVARARTAPPPMADDWT